MIISVALCTYNGEKYIKEQLDSIINQTYQVDEIIVCDDSSTDKTLQILKEYAFQYPNLISIFENKTNLRTIKNFEKGISLTSGDLIFLADQDDIWKTTKVEIIVDYYKNTKNFKLVFTNGDLIDDKGNLMNSTLWDEWGFSKERRKLWLDNDKAYKDLVLNKNKITGATVCINKSIKSNAIPIYTPDGYWHDAWLGLHAAAQGGLCFIEQSLILYRIHESQQIGISKKTKKMDIPKKTSSVSKNEFYSYLNRLYPYKSYLLPNYKKKTNLNPLALKFRKLKNRVKLKIKHFCENQVGDFYFKHEGFCPCCEKEVLFVAKHSWLRDHFKCNSCNSIPRERALMHTIKNDYPNWKNLTIHESSPGNRGHSVLLKKNAKNYTVTQFFMNADLGSTVNGVRNEDLERQTFQDASFDLVVTSDVMEHIYEPEKAFKEIFRTLKPGGAHIFSVPIINKHIATQRWATKNDDGSPNFLFEPEWHGNPVDKKGSPVTFHWGYDIKEFIEKHTSALCEIIYIDDLNYGIRAEYIEIVVMKKPLK